MTIATTTNRVDVPGNGGATTFSFSPMTIFDASNLVVTIRDSSGNETLLSQGAGSNNFSVTVASYPGTGSITYPAAGGTPVPSGSTVIIKRVVPITQSVHLENQGAYLANVQEGEFDYLTAIDQQQQEQLNRTLQLATTDPSAPLTLPSSAARANQILGFDSLGRAMSYAAVPPAAVSAPMAPVILAGSTASALSLLGGATSASVTTVSNNLSTLTAIAEVSIATIAALRASAGALPPAVFVAGYSAAADGGQGVFVYVSSDTTSADNSGTIIVDAAGRRWYRDTEGRPLQLEWFGGGVNNANNATAWNLAVAASGNDVRIAFRKGQYTFTSTASVTCPIATSTVSIVGEGPELTRLYFTSGGLQIRLLGPNNSFHVRDMSLLTTGAGAATGLNIVQTAASITNPAETQLSDVTNVSLRGSDGLAATNYWATGINVSGASCINFINVFSTGPSGRAGNAILTSGTSSVIPVLFNLTGCVLNNANVGFYYGNYTQGVTISQCNVTFTNHGVYVPTGLTALAQLAIIGSQFNCNVYCINILSNPPGTVIMGNFFIPVNGSTVIAYSQAGAFSIIGNTFWGLGTTGTTGIDITNSSASGVISGNLFQTMATRAVFLETTATNVSVQSNSYFSCGVNVTNSGGASNSVGVATP